MAKRLTDDQVQAAITKYLIITNRHEDLIRPGTYRYRSSSAAEIARAVHVSKKRAEEILHRLNEECLVYARLGRRRVMKYKWANQKEIDRMRTQRKFSERYNLLSEAAKSVGIEVGYRGDISMSLDTFEMLLTAYEESR